MDMDAVRNEDWIPKSASCPGGEHIFSNSKMRMKQFTRGLRDDKFRNVLPASGGEHFLQS